MADNHIIDYIYLQYPTEKKYFNKEGKGLKSSNAVSGQISYDVFNYLGLGLNINHGEPNCSEDTNLIIEQNQWQKVDISISCYTNYTIPYFTLIYKFMPSKKYYVNYTIGMGIPIEMYVDYSIVGGGDVIMLNNLKSFWGEMRATNITYQANPFTFFTEVNLGYKIFSWLGIGVDLGFQYLRSDNFKVVEGSEAIPKGTVFSKDGKPVDVNFNNFYAAFAVKFII
ncbi:MAG: hypothetical protein OEZ22_12670 [Spirochaetia bacterium]|nr:hypothetical protein [Spirochaetia bacterium]